MSEYMGCEKKSTFFLTTELIAGEALLLNRLTKTSA